MTGRITRRSLLSLMASACGAGLTRALAEEEKPSDRGIGGTGITAGNDVARPAAIGFIGTIQRFGSIYVNDSRITYPTDVAVWIDGRRRSASALSIGQVVRTVAHPGAGDKLIADRIDIVSEVIGPITSLTDNTLVVMGQTVDLVDGKRPSWWQPGARAAVSGIRTTEGRIVGSRIEPAGSRPDQVVGVPSLEGWNLRIGDLPLLGITPQYSGWRVVVQGSPTAGGLMVRRVRLDTPFAGANVGRLSVETFIERSGSVLLSSTGADLSGIPMGPSPDGHLDVRAVMNIDVGDSGDMRLSRLALNGGPSFSFANGMPGLSGSNNLWQLGGGAGFSGNPGLGGGAPPSFGPGSWNGPGAFGNSGGMSPGSFSAGGARFGGSPDR